VEKRTVKFYSEGIRLKGDLYLPSDLKAGERRPGIVPCHGFRVCARRFSATTRKSSSTRALSRSPSTIATSSMARKHLR
jgi:hypothetical protein